MKTYHCEIGSFMREIAAQSPEQAAKSCVLARLQHHAWFATETPSACAVMVDGVEYLPASHAPAGAAHVWS